MTSATTPTQIASTSSAIPFGPGTSSRQTDPSILRDRVGSAIA
jgi:hypothetical protein